ncbi:MAG: DNA recombination protein RmuC [Rickettsiales bacterium]|jgi:DNA recombination protein RmuC|nr:DNA recombination protein RmuC [Rickettsiales bacterium]
MILFAIITAIFFIATVSFFLGERKELRSKIDILEKERVLLEKNNGGLVAECRLVQNNNRELCGKIENYKRDLENNNKLLLENEKYRTQLVFMGETIEKLKNEMFLQFKNISNDVIRQQKSDFDIAQKESFGIILNPLNKEIQDFKKKITDFDKDVNENKVEIREKINILVEQTIKIGEEANNLTKALMGDKKMQGNWGELRLINLLESAGFVEDEDFFTQKAEKNSGDETVIFDCVVKIPGEKFLIIDSKVSIVNYEKYVNSESEEEREYYMKMYRNDIKNHIEELGKKEYHRILKTNSPDFVFMFLPLENAYLDVIRYDKDLFNLAMKQKVAMTTASSLIPVVNMIKNLWDIEKQNKNIQSIVDCANTIYNKIRKFAERIDIIEKNLNNAKKSCTEAKSYLSSGRDNILRTCNKMMKLGGKNDSGLLLLEERVVEVPEEELLEEVEG